MIINLQGVDMEALGVEFAKMGHEAQSLFLRGVSCELKFWLSSDRQTQFHAVADKLTEIDKNILHDAFSCIWYKDKK